jgi:hypothetical protein
MRNIRSAVLVIVAFVAVATAPYLVFRDNSFARLIDHQSQTQSQDQISYDDQFADLRAQIDRMGRQDEERLEEIKSLRQRQETLEQVTSGLAKDLLIQAIQARNGLPVNGTIESAPGLSATKATSEIPHVDAAKQAEKTATNDNKKVRRPVQKQMPVVRKRTPEAPAVAADRNAIEPATQQNY